MSEPPVSSPRFDETVATLAELFGYTSDLRNVTSGTASFSMEPSHYAPVKEELADIRIAS